MIRQIGRNRAIALTLRAFFWLLVALVFWSAAAARFRLPELPLTNRDSWSYVHTAWSKFTGGPFEHINGRNFVYPGFLFLVLSGAKTLGAITLVQHLAGLGTGALMLACWQRLRRFVQIVPGALYSLGGLAVAAIYLLSSRPMQYEHDLRPEAITPFFVLLNLFLTLVFFEQRCGRPPSNRAAIVGAAILFNSVFLVALKSSFGLTVCFSVVPVLVGLISRRETWSRRFAVVAAGLLPLFAFVFIESRLAQNDRESRAFVPTSLFSIHANLIADQLDADVARGDCDSYGCERLRAIATALRADMARSWTLSHTYRSFGFDPDFLKHDEGAMPSWTTRFFDGDDARMLAFCRHYYWRTVLHQPGAMIGKVLSQVGLFYRLHNPGFKNRYRVPTDILYRESAANFRGLGYSDRERALVASYVSAADKLAGEKHAFRSPLPVVVAVWILAFAYLPVLIALLVFALACAFGRPTRSRNFRYALTVLFLFSPNFGNVLGTAIMHSLHIVRYSETQYAFSLFAVCGGLMFLLELALQLAARACVPLRLPFARWPAAR